MPLHGVHLSKWGAKTSVRVVGARLARCVRTRIGEPVLRELGAEVSREREGRRLRLGADDLDLGETVVLEPLDDVADEDLGNRRAGGEADGRGALEPRGVELLRLVDAVGGARTGLEGELDEAP